MKIDNTSMFFNASIKDGTATAAWGTAAGQSAQNGYKIKTDLDGLIDILIGMNYKIKTDKNNLDISKMSSSRELLMFSIFDKVFINNIQLDDTSFILLLVKEHSESHDGRIIISYPNYVEYSDSNKKIQNSASIEKMAKKLKCLNGCWFVYDISIVNQDELHFSAVVVDSSPKIYLSSQQRRNEWDELVKRAIAPTYTKVDFKAISFLQKANKANYFINEKLSIRFISSLLAKPFVILTGLSGSGKTKLAQAFAIWICEDENQYCMVPVGADWTNREPLLGFPNALKPDEYVKPDNGVLDLIIEANKNESKPYFLILDEMNLSHVERYFADFLSVMESKNNLALHSGDSEWNGVPAQIGFPKNLFIIGTVNIDETTYMFSPKVLDRASVIEFRVTAAEMESYLGSNSQINLDDLKGEGKNMAESFVALANDTSLEATDAETLNKTLMSFFAELKKTGAEFGYRSASEIIRFAAVANKLDNDWKENEIIDAAIMQKLLPKVHGSRRKLEPVLKTLGTLCLQDGQKMDDYVSKSEIDFADNSKIKYPVSLEKILRMYQSLISNGFTSYAEA